MLSESLCIYYAGTYYNNTLISFSTPTFFKYNNYIRHNIFFNDTTIK